MVITCEVVNVSDDLNFIEFIELITEYLCKRTLTFLLIKTVRKIKKNFHKQFLLEINTRAINLYNNYAIRYRQRKKRCFVVLYLLSTFY